ncbi:MAG: patatin-like phospholipase family protein [Bacteroidales bacterium]|nr:patatin-like phospholipase family protein [Bacteroidales bacterium]
MQTKTKTCTTALVLSGGGVRGISHLGVLKALDERNIKIDCISGSSAGALAGALYSAGHTPEEILNIISSKKIYELIRFSIPKTGLFSIAGLQKTLEKNLPFQKIEELPIPLTIAVTNFLDASLEYLSEGPLIESLLASASIPALFNVTKLKGMPYIDGGVMDNLPVQPFIGKADRIIASYCNPVGKIKKVHNPALIAERAFHMAIRSDIHKKAEMVDAFIEPEKLEKFSMFALHKARDIFDLGYDEAVKVLDTLKLH